MRRLFLSFVLVGLALVSCESKNPVEQYGDDVIKAYKGTEKVAGQASVQNLQNAIRGFHAANGRYPNDLKELEGFSGIPLDPALYDYDPSSGVITAKR